MRIVIDMQGAQTASRIRGIGRYTMSFTQAVLRNRGEHEIILALSGLFPESIEPIRNAFNTLLPQENIRVWSAPDPLWEAETNNNNAQRYAVAELLREAFLANLCPDVLHISSLFEGYGDDAVTSIGRFDQRTPVSVMLYDLIPLLNADQYLAHNPVYAQQYHSKLAYLMRPANLLLAISEFARREGLEHLGLPATQIVNISSAIDLYFTQLDFDSCTAQQIRSRFGLSRPFVLYTGSDDQRKNLPRLIQAYAALPHPLRNSHQLLFVGHNSPEGIARLQQVATNAGLENDALLFAGYVSDTELVQLYNLCALYVFPSWHEGFGLPALEAMACGAAVIGANTSSLPEVIGLDEALFDPMDITSIAAKMEQGLADNAFRQRLKVHGLQQAQHFSWDKTAKRAIAAWESLYTTCKANYANTTYSQTRLYQALTPHIKEMPELDLECCNLAYNIALNQQAGIERQLLLDVSELCQRDAATGVQRVVRSYLQQLLQEPPIGFRVEPVYATTEIGYCYARRFTLRFIGQNNHEGNDEPIRWQRGDIFFAVDMQHHVQIHHRDFYQRLREQGVTVKFLVYDLLPIQLSKIFEFEDSEKALDAKALHEQWLRVIAASDGAICISKATADAYAQWLYNERIATVANFTNTWVHIGADIDSYKHSLGLPLDADYVLRIMRIRPSFLCVATLEPRKRQQQILESLELLWAKGYDFNLILVGHRGWHIDTLIKRIDTHPERGGRLFWLRGVSDEYLERIYAASTCLVAASINEGFGLPLIEAARHHIPIIARYIPVFREVAGTAAFYFKGDSGAALAQAIEDWFALYQQDAHPKPEAMHWLTWQESTEKLKTALITHNYPRHQLLVDISELVQRDVKSGIQRVVRSILQELLLHPPHGYRVEPVYATLEHGYRYARGFNAKFLGNVSDISKDEYIEYAPGDIFFALDLQPQVQIAQQGFFQALRRQGIRVVFCVYDLLSIKLPQYFPHGAAHGFTQWLSVVLQSDGAVCISQAIANELREYQASHHARIGRPLEINWFHLGADIINPHSTQGLQDNSLSTLAKLSAQPSFLVVSTIEPRKAHAQVLDAFEQLWEQGFAINLVIVGKQGWMVEDLIARLQHHQELNKRLFWLEGISDEYLEKVYAASSCLIAASYGEGFGLPLIEAAQHQLPIIARDLPVFREVAGEHAYYFQSESAADLAPALQRWLALYQEGRHPQSEGMPWLTWQQSATILLERLGITQTSQ